MGCNDKISRTIYLFKIRNYSIYAAYQSLLRGWIKDTFVEKALLLEKAEEAKPTPSVVAGLSLAKKKQIFYDLVALQDKYMYQDPYNTQKQHDAYREIAKRHNVSEKKVREIAIEGIKKRWPTPPTR